MFYIAARMDPSRSEQVGRQACWTCVLVDCKEEARSSFMKYRKHHAVVSLTDVPYRRIYAWVLEQMERFKKPLAYTHPQGAVIWIRLGLQD